jgi:hypothetical protein
MKRLSDFAATRTHWKELAADSRSARFPPSDCMPLAQAAAIRQVERASSAHSVRVPSRACRPGGGRSEHAVVIARKTLR